MGRPVVERYARLGDGALTAHVFLIRRGGHRYVAAVTLGGVVEYNAFAVPDDRAETTFKRAVRSLTAPPDLFKQPMQVQTRTLGDDGRRALAVLDHPVFGLDWHTVKPAKTDAQEFTDLLDDQLAQWKGSAWGLPVMKHAGWPRFHRKLVAAVRREYGDPIRLYRGVHGDQAKAILAGARGADALLPLSSWTPDKAGARVFQRLGKNTPWALLRADVRPDDVVLAPVEVEGYPFLRRLGRDVEFSGDEFILRPVPFRVVAQPRQRRLSRV